MERKRENCRPLAVTRAKIWALQAPTVRVPPQKYLSVALRRPMVFNPALERALCAIDARIVTQSLTFGPGMLDDTAARVDAMVAIFANQLTGSRLLTRETLLGLALDKGANVQR